jgi:acyl-CoA synthetase (NDP forming)
VKQEVLKTVMTDYDRIFHPRRIAIVGVSTEGMGFGSGIYIALTSIGFEGDIYLVNPKGGNFRGKEIYRSVDAIPEPIDFAIIAVAAQTVPAVLEACRLKGAAGAEILSAGFKELGTAEGKALEKAVQEIACKGIRVIGPNCFGIYCPKSGLTVLPGPDLSRENGPVSFLSQSGGMAIDYANEGKSIGVRFSKVVSFGNGADLRETELLRYLGDDPETRIINMYIEGIEDGDAFFAAMKEVAPKKPVVVYKGGLSEAGRRAVVSHTASMGGSRVIWPRQVWPCRFCPAGFIGTWPSWEEEAPSVSPPPMQPSHTESGFPRFRPKS